MGSKNKNGYPALPKIPSPWPKKDILPLLAAPAAIKVANPFRQEFLSGLKKGDVFETEGPFEGLGRECLVWRLVQSDEHWCVFNVTYFGAFFGAFNVRIDGSEVRERS